MTYTIKGIDQASGFALPNWFFIRKSNFYESFNFAFGSK